MTFAPNDIFFVRSGNREDAERHHGHPLPAGRVRELITGLAAQKQDLQAFAAAMESEFFDLGSSLRKIVHLSRDIRQRCDDITSAATGHTEDAAIQFAFQLLKKAEDLVYASRDIFSRVLEVFSNMNLDLKELDRERIALMWTLSPLDSIHTQFRVQASFFDEEIRRQFFTLATNIAGIASEVRTAVESRFEELSRTSHLTAELVANLARLIERQKLETYRLLAETRENLSSMSQVLQSSEASAQSLAEAGKRIGGGVAKAIVALQCQDMTRQKLEHINAAMDEMSDQLAPGADSGLQADEADACCHFLARAGRVQLNQLEVVFDQLNEAAQQVGAGLGEVETEANAFVDYAQSSASTALDGPVIGRAIRSIRSVLGVIGTAVANVRSVAELVGKLKSTFSNCNFQIMDLAVSLRLAAINAQIVASQSNTGAVLEVVASCTRGIADEAKRQLTGISSRVSKLESSVIDLEQRLDNYHELAAMEQEVLTLEAGQAETRLLRLGADLQTALQAMRTLEETLSSTIRTTSSSIRFPQAVAAIGGRTKAFFEAVVHQYDDSAAASPSDVHRRLENLKLNYTMANERCVHASAVGADERSTDQPENQNVFVGQSDSDLADNVELF